MSVQGLFDKLGDETKRRKAQLLILVIHKFISGILKLAVEPHLIPEQTLYTPDDTKTESVYAHYMTKDEDNMAPGQQKQRLKCNPAEVLLKLVLLATQSHFETPGILDEKRMATILLMGKKLMERSQRDAESR